MRLGYITGNAGLLSRIRNNRMPWAVNAVAIEAGLFLTEKGVPHSLDMAVYLDESLRKFDTVYPAAGNGYAAVKLTLQELEAAAGVVGLVVVFLVPEGE